MKWWIFLANRKDAIRCCKFSQYTSHKNGPGSDRKKERRSGKKSREIPDGIMATERTLVTFGYNSVCIEFGAEGMPSQFYVRNTWKFAVFMGAYTIRVESGESFHARVRIKRWIICLGDWATGLKDGYARARMRPIRSIYGLQTEKCARTVLKYGRNVITVNPFWLDKILARRFLLQPDRKSNATTLLQLKINSIASGALRMTDALFDFKSTTWLWHFTFQVSALWSELLNGESGTGWSLLGNGLGINSIHTPHCTLSMEKSR